MRIMATGPRAWDYTKYNEFVLALDEFQTTITEDITVISGGAQGFDIAMAKAASELNIPFEIWLPNPTYISYYYKGKGYNPTALGKPATIEALMEEAKLVHYSSKSVYVNITRDNKTTKMHSNFQRNIDMMNSAEAAVVGVMSLSELGISGGTSHAVRNIKATKMPMYNQAFEPIN